MLLLVISSKGEISGEAVSGAGVGDDPERQSAVAEDHDPKLSVGGSARLRFESWRNGDIVPDFAALDAAGSAWRRDYDDDYTLTNLKLHLNAELTEKFSVFIELEHSSLESSTKLNEHRRYKSKIHFQQAFLRYEDLANQLTVGRQTLNYGSRLVLGTDMWLNNTVSYDVVRYDHFSDIVDASFFGGIEAFEPHDDIDPENVVGGYHFTFRPGGWQVEQYTFYKEHDLKNGAENFDVYSFGSRIKNSWDKYDIDFDVVKQFGDRRGFAGHGLLARNLTTGHWSDLKVYTAFNVASGGKKDEEDYVPFAPASHLSRQSTDYSPYINLKEYGFGVTASPLKNNPLFVRISWFDMYMYDRQGAIYSFDPSTIVWGKQFNISSDHLGQHLSVFAAYEFEKTNTKITACWNKYFIDKAIEQFPDRKDNTFFYLSVIQPF